MGKHSQKQLRGAAAARSQEPLLLAALRGEFGRWAYYVALMPTRDLAARVSYADEIHKNERLGEMIQRELNATRAKEILEYLQSTQERFFSSIVVGVYGGKPSWNELALRNRETDVDTLSVGDVPGRVRGSVGVLSLSGTEKLFALDGQHRLAGIRLANEKSGTLRDAEELCVIFVAHSQSAQGMERTRRLFTTLNKKARKVTKGEVIALDEDDICAIAARRMVDDDAWFQEPRVAIKATNKIGPEDSSALTTIGNLYDVLRVLFVAAAKTNAGELLRVRPKDDDVEVYLEYARAFFRALAKEVPAIGAFFGSKTPAVVVGKHRTASGGHLLYRPAGLRVAAECVARLIDRRKKPLDKGTMIDAVRHYAQTPMSLTDLPFKHVLWDPQRKVMDLRGRSLARDLLLYMLRVTEHRRSLQTRLDTRLGDNAVLVADLPRF